ncbi:MAG TPA: efflux RND transporter permease subunit [Burkholderiales bacterium]|nr:efflux RND transporter permease subunit [Burkholderiales bacterium]
MANFFISRPIFAIVIAILIMVAGGLSIFSLPIAQYPNVAPPSVQITTQYPGASAETVQDTVIQVIEQQMSGLDHLLYLSSTSDNFGMGILTLSFEPGTNPDIAQVQVQNKLSLAIPILPQTVQQVGISVTKSSTSYLLVAGFVSEDGSMSKFDIANYVVSHLQDPLSRLNGVGNFSVFGTQYAMRIWLDPGKLNSYGLTPVDVANAVQAQNIQVSAGQLGGSPAPTTQRLNAAITEATLLRTPEQFGAIVLKVNTDGSRVLVRDVARVELGAENYNVDNKYNGKPASGIGFQLASGANALDTANAIKAKIAELSKYFPPGLQVVYPYDTTPFIKISITEVVKTLFEGVALVVLVILLFLQNVRTTLIPTVTVPVVLLGTFGVMAAVGFSINTLTMFGMVLAIGLLVDDAIVVVENVERIMTEEGLSPREATRKAMGQISAALVGVALVISAVFVPTAFTTGSVGAIYRQFSLTIVVAMLLSVFVALSLTPALCAMLLTPVGEGRSGLKRWFGWFNRGFDSGREKYVHGVRQVIGRSGRFLMIYLALLVAVGLLFVRLPSSFLPAEDQGFMFVQVQTPAGATQGFTGIVLDDVSNYLLQDEARVVDAVFQVNGNNFAGRGQNQGMLFVRFKDWSRRQAKSLKVDALVGRVFRRFASYKNAVIIPINIPPIRELGTASGFDFELEDRGGIGHEALVQARNQLLALARKDRQLALVRVNGEDDQPTFKVNIDREKATALGVNLTDIDQSFSIAWGSHYVNNFLDTDGRIKKVYVQADAPFRMTPDDLRLLYVSNSSGTSSATGTSSSACSSTSASSFTTATTNVGATIVPFSAFATGLWTYGPAQLQRYNGVPSFEIQGQAAPGYSTGQAMSVMEKLAQQLPAGVGYEWTGLSLQEQLSGSQAPLLFALSVLVVFLSLAALYESWSIPVSVVMVVPLGVLGAVGAATAFGMENDVYFKVGLLTTIGLSAKNAILIVEFARELHAQGRSVIEAAVEAARLRLRPILMTSMAFVLGVLPLALANGAGSASENAVGTGVIGGMLTATFLAPFLIPMFYVVVSEKLAREKRIAPAAAPVRPPAPSSIPAGDSR